jgi:2-dehydro-3-deoxygalactonokinase
MSATLIALDWGTTSLRACLADARGRVLDRRESADGIMAVPDRDFARVLAAAIGGWRDGAGGPAIVMSGMIGSRQGWVEAPYLQCPAGLAEIAEALTVIPSPLGPVHLVPGLATSDAQGRPDVMRGEETQILGALALAGADCGRYVLPGTHAKWVDVAQGRITGFATYMTGEVFAALRGHTILGRLMSSEAGTGRGFAEGVAAARTPGGPGQLLHLVFHARTLALFDRLPQREVADFLSGLLIGVEIIEAAGTGGGFAIVAGDALAERYAAAAARLGLAATRPPADCAPAGAAAIARAAGLIARSP